MAVERVIGKTDSFEVIFDRLNDNNWTVNVPSNIIGEYVMDLYAYDEAGNHGFLATAMFTVDTSNLCFHLSIIKYRSEICFESDYICTVKEVLPCVMK